MADPADLGSYLGVNQEYQSFTSPRRRRGRPLLGRVPVVELIAYLQTNVNTVGTILVDHNLAIIADAFIWFSEPIAVM